MPNPTLDIAGLLASLIRQSQLQRRHPFPGFDQQPPTPWTWPVNLPTDQVPQMRGPIPDAPSVPSRAPVIMPTIPQAQPLPPGMVRDITPQGFVERPWLRRNQDLPMGFPVATPPPRPVAPPVVSARPSAPPVAAPPTGPRSLADAVGDLARGEIPNYPNAPARSGVTGAAANLIGPQENFFDILGQDVDAVLAQLGLGRPGTSRSPVGRGTPPPAAVPRASAVPGPVTSQSFRDVGDMARGDELGYAGPPPVTRPPTPARTTTAGTPRPAGQDLPASLDMSRVAGLPITPGPDAAMIARQLGFDQTPNIKAPEPGLPVGPTPPRVELTAPPPAAVKAEAVKPPMWKQVLGEAFSGLPDALIAYAAARFDKPEIADNWLKQRALKIQQATDAAERDIEREKNVTAQAWKRLEFEKGLADSRGNVRDRASALNRDLAEGKLKDLKDYFSQLNLLANDYAGYKGNYDDLVKGFPVPFADRLDTLSADVDRYITTYQNDETKMNAAPFRDPYTDKAITVEQALTLLGRFDLNTGTPLLPNQAITPVTHQVNGETVIDYLATNRLLGKRFKAPPQANTTPWQVMATPTDSGGTTLTPVTGAGGKVTVGQTATLPTPQKGIGADIEDLKTMALQQARERAAKIVWWMQHSPDPMNPDMTKIPNPNEITTIMNDPTYAEQLRAIILKGGGK